MIERKQVIIKNAGMGIGDAENALLDSEPIKHKTRKRKKEAKDVQVKTKGITG